MTRVGSMYDEEDWMWIALGAVAGALGAIVARRLAGAGYKAITDDEPPKNLDSPEVSTGEALGFAVISALLGAVGRLMARRAASSWYFGRKPPRV